MNCTSNTRINLANTKAGRLTPCMHKVPSVKLMCCGEETISKLNRVLGYPPSIQSMRLSGWKRISVEGLRVPGDELATYNSASTRARNA